MLQEHIEQLPSPSVSAVRNERDEPSGIEPMDLEAGSALGGPAGLNSQETPVFATPIPSLPANSLETATVNPLPIDPGSARDVEPTGEPRVDLESPAHSETAPVSSV